MISAKTVFKFLLTVALGMFTSVPAILADSATMPVETQPVQVQSGKDSAAARAEAARLRIAGVRDALKGDFEKAYRRFVQATKVAPEQKKNGVAELELIRKHLSQAKADNAQRREEYQAAVRRVEQCLLAQKYLPEPPEDENTSEEEADQEQDAPKRWDVKLREKVNEAIDTFDETPDGELVELASEEELAELKSDAEKSLTETISDIRSIKKGAPQDQSEYSSALQNAVDRAIVALERYRDLWRSVEATSEIQQHDKSIELQLSEGDLLHAIGEVESMLAEKPWLRALSYGQRARDLAADVEELPETEWYRKLVSEADSRGKNAVENAKWYDALAAYSGLKEINPDSTEYKYKTKVIGRHVRVLELYGDDEQEKPKALEQEKPKALKEQEQEQIQEQEQEQERREHGGRTWRDIVKGVDKDMIEKVISRLARHYVSSIDYPEVIRGGLMSVRVLIETPQAGATFPALKDDERREAMLDAIDTEIKAIKQRSRVDQLDLKLTLNNLLNASEATVDIPIDVLAVEFADGFLNELDRFSSMIWPYEVEDFNKQTMGRFFGVGIQITKQPNGPLKVVTPLAGSPAMKAGIRTGDTIVAVDSGDGMEKTNELTIDACVKRIMGKKGTKVTLRVKRKGMSKHFNVDVVRDEINIHTVAGWQRLPGGGWDYILDPKAKIGYIRIRQFTATTTDDLVQVLKQLKAQKVRSIVLDLRENPGGLLREAGAVADQFLKSGKIVSTRGRGGRLRTAAITASDSEGEYENGELIVLVNQHSASAAEIVSGALKELGRAVVVGRRTYGKGSVQNVIPIPRHKAFLKLTTAYYYVGDNEKLVHRRDGDKEWGVGPHVQVRMTPRQARKLYTLQRKTEVIRDVPPEQIEGDLEQQFEADKQLRTAVFLLKLMQLQGQRPAAVLTKK